MRCKPRQPLSPRAEGRRPVAAARRGFSERSSADVEDRKGTGFVSKDKLQKMLGMQRMSGDAKASVPPGHHDRVLMTAKDSGSCWRR